MSLNGLISKESNNFLLYRAQDPEVHNSHIISIYGHERD